MPKLDELFDRPMPGDAARVIAIRGAREHNLKNVDLTIPRDKLVVFTGLSGSGKSSLAFDTIYAEGSGAMSSRCRPMRASSSR
jgi:excinuclease ABC subunit A